MITTINFQGKLHTHKKLLNLKVVYLDSFAFSLGRLRGEANVLTIGFLLQCSERPNIVINILNSETSTWSNVSAKSYKAQERGLLNIRITFQWFHFESFLNFPESSVWHYNF